MTSDLQKAGMTKRLAAAMLDFILLIVLVTGIATILAAVLGFQQYADSMDAVQQRYETEYQVELDLTQEEYAAMSQQEREVVDKAVTALMKDSEFLHAYEMQVNLILLIITLGVLGGVMILEFVVPLLLKNGQTVGKKVFSIALVRPDSVKISAFQLFVRTILGKFTIELMIPIYILITIYFGTANIISLMILAALAIGQIICMVMSHTNALLHDTLASTVAVEMATQRIFSTKEELIEYTKKIHAERVNRSGS